MRLVTRPPVGPAPEAEPAPSARAAPGRPAVRWSRAGGGTGSFGLVVAASARLDARAAASPHTACGRLDDAAADPRTDGFGAGEAGHPWRHSRCSRRAPAPVFLGGRPAGGDETARHPVRFEG